MADKKKVTKSKKGVTVSSKKGKITVGSDDVIIKAKGKKGINVSKKVVVSIVAIILVAAIALTSCYFLVPSFKNFVNGLFSKNTISNADGELTVHFVDVGQGDCIIIQLPDGKNIIMDAGGSKYNTKENSDILGIITKKIDSLNIKVFDYMILTHGDGDHVEYMDEILGKYSVKTIYRPMFLSKTESLDNPQSPIACQETGLYDTFIKAVDNEIATEGAKEVMNVGKPAPIEGVGYKMDMYCMNEEFYSKEKVGSSLDAYESNAASPISILTYKGDGDDTRKIAFTGDAEGKEGGNGNGAELDFIKNYPTAKVNVDVIKAGHHGSKTSTSTEILDFFDPEYCVTSVGTNMEHGHPTPEFTERINSYKDKVLSDDNDGIVGFYMTKDRGDIRLNIDKACQMNWIFDIPLQVA